MATEFAQYAARLEIDYPERLDRLSSFFRIIWSIPIIVILGVLTNSGMVGDEAGGVARSGGGIVASLAVATALMIVFRKRYPRWWFDFARELTRFETRVGS